MRKPRKRTYENYGSVLTVTPNYLSSDDALVEIYTDAGWAEMPIRANQVGLLAAAFSDMDGYTRERDDR